MDDGRWTMRLYRLSPIVRQVSICCRFAIHASRLCPSRSDLLLAGRFALAPPIGEPRPVPIHIYLKRALQNLAWARKREGSMPPMKLIVVGAGRRGTSYGNYALYYAGQVQMRAEA